MSTLSNLCGQLGIVASVRPGNRVKLEPGDTWRSDSNAWTVTLRLEGRRLTVPFFTGSGWTTEPTAADVLSSLCLDASCGELSFEEFCAEMGYDSDSRSAGRTWRACAKTAPRLATFLGTHRSAISEAEH